MSRRVRITFLFASTAVLSFFTTDLGRLATAQLPPPRPDAAASEATTDAEVETMLRGPLHEAFAEPIQFNPAPGPVVSKQPPEPIEELPPETETADQNAIWIPGYWSWDDEREDFIWTSGVWRVPPPQKRWVPGYWMEADGGHRWIAGFWIATDAEQIEYLPSPPESLERGPTSPQPSENDYWVSGCWQHNGDRYVWRPGYWGTFHAGWTWAPAHYVWTPRGAIYVDGYWDYSLTRRGQLFAPVYFRSPVYARPGFHYSPNVAVDAGQLLLHLFVHPQHHHYYWGDYYGDGYRRRGYQGWFDFHGQHGYDPLFAYYRTHYQHQNIDYARRLRGWHQYLDTHEDRRPAHTFARQAELAARVKQDSQFKHTQLGRKIGDLAVDNDPAVRERRRQNEGRRLRADSAIELRGLTDERAKLERDRTPKSQREGGSDAKRVSGEEQSPHVVLKLPDTPRFSAPKSTPQPPARTPKLSDAAARSDPASQRPRIGSKPGPGPGQVQGRKQGPGPGQGRKQGQGQRPKVRTDQLPQPNGLPTLPDAPPDRIRGNKRSVEGNRQEAAPRNDRVPKVERRQPARPDVPKSKPRAKSERQGKLPTVASPKQPKNGGGKK